MSVQVPELVLVQPQAQAQEQKTPHSCIATRNSC